MSVSIFQLRMGISLIGVFAVGLVVLNARTPEPVDVKEQSLGNIVRDGISEFKEGFGAFPDTVLDNGGDQPTPFDGLAPQRFPQYRSAQWLVEQPTTGYTIQLGVFSSERAATNFMSSTGNSADLRYFEIPEMPDPALGLVTTTKSRFVVSYGEFFSSDEAVAVAGSMSGFGEQYVVRAWQSYQITLASVNAVLAKNRVAQQAALAQVLAATAATEAANALATDAAEVAPYQGVDPVEALRKPPVAR